MTTSNSYSLLDCGDKEKLEKFGEYILIRPCPQAIWPKTTPELWTKNIDAKFVRTTEERGNWQWDQEIYFFDQELERAGYEDEKKFAPKSTKEEIYQQRKSLRDQRNSKFTKHQRYEVKDSRVNMGKSGKLGGGNDLKIDGSKTVIPFVAKKAYTSAGSDPSKTPVPKSWTITSRNGLKWQIEPNEFGNVGVFTEHWEYAEDLGLEFEKKSNVLNLFTYSGSNCVSLVKKGHLVTAVDSSKSAMNCYTTNLELNGLPREGQRLVLEDCVKFMQREIRRGVKYGAIMIDAPSYGRGTKGEVFKIEDDLIELLNMAKELMNSKSHLIVTLHSPRFTPKILEILAKKMFPSFNVNSNEILPICKSGVEIPSGFLLKIQPVI